jgi:hypothetical protein
MGAKMTPPENEKTRLDELRFAKKQQWSIATATMTLLGAIFGVAHAMAPLGPWEKAVGSILTILVMFFGNLHLWSLQNHLADTRRLIDAKDEDAWWRGASILYSLMGALIIAGLVVVYYVTWRLPT